MLKRFCDNILPRLGSHTPQEELINPLITEQSNRTVQQSKEKDKNDPFVDNGQPDVSAWDGKSDFSKQSSLSIDSICQSSAASSAARARVVPLCPAMPEAYHLILQLQSDDVQAQVEAAETIYKLTRSDDKIADTFVSLGVIEPLVALLQSNNRGPEVHATRILRNMVIQSSACHEQLVNAGIVRPLITLLQSSHENIHDQVLAIIQHLLSERDLCSDQLIDAGLIPLLIAKLQSRNTNTKLQAAIGISKLTKSNRATHCQFVSAGGVDALITQLPTHSTWLQNTILHIIECLIENDDKILNQFISSGIIPHVINLIKNDQRVLNVPLLLTACHLIHSSKETCDAFAYNPHVGRYIIKNHKHSNQSLKLHIVEAIGNIVGWATWDETKKFLGVSESSSYGSTPEVCDIIFEGIEHENINMRTNFISLLFNIYPYCDYHIKRNKRTGPVCSALLQSSDPDIQETTARIILMIISSYVKYGDFSLSDPNGWNILSTLDDLLFSHNGIIEEYAVAILEKITYNQKFAEQVIDTDIVSSLDKLDNSSKVQHKEKIRTIKNNLSYYQEKRQENKSKNRKRA